METEGNEIFTRIDMALTKSSGHPSDARLLGALAEVQFWDFDTSMISKKTCADARILDSLRQISQRSGVRLKCMDVNSKILVVDVPDLTLLPEVFRLKFRDVDSILFDLIEESQGVKSGIVACGLIQKWSYVRDRGTVASYVRGVEWRDWLIHQFNSGQQFENETCPFAPDSAKKRVNRRRYTGFNNNFREIW